MGDSPFCFSCNNIAPTTCENHLCAEHCKGCSTHKGLGNKNIKNNSKLPQNPNNQSYNEHNNSSNNGYYSYAYLSESELQNMNSKKKPRPQQTAIEKQNEAKKKEEDEIAKAIQMSLGNNVPAQSEDDIFQKALQQSLIEADQNVDFTKIYNLQAIFPVFSTQKVKEILIECLGDEEKAAEKLLNTAPEEIPPPPGSVDEIFYDDDGYDEYSNSYESDLEYDSYEEEEEEEEEPENDELILEMQRRLQQLEFEKFKLETQNKQKEEQLNELSSKTSIIQNRERECAICLLETVKIFITNCNCQVDICSNCFSDLRKTCPICRNPTTLVVK